MEETIWTWRIYLIRHISATLSATCQLHIYQPDICQPDRSWQATPPWRRRAPGGGWPACWSLRHRCLVWSWGWRAWPPGAGGGAGRGRVCVGQREGGSGEGALWAGAWWAAELCLVDLKEDKQGLSLHGPAPAEIPKWVYSLLTNTWLMLAQMIWPLWSPVSWLTMLWNACWLSCLTADKCCLLAWKPNIEAFVTVTN